MNIRPWLNARAIEAHKLMRAHPCLQSSLFCSQYCRSNNIAAAKISFFSTTSVILPKSMVNRLIFPHNSAHVNAFLVMVATCCPSRVTGTAWSAQHGQHIPTWHKCTGPTRMISEPISSLMIESALQQKSGPGGSKTLPITGPSGVSLTVNSGPEAANKQQRENGHKRMAAGHGGIGQ